jgi:hypothetical protein
MIDHLHRQVLLGEPPGKAMKVLTSSLKYNIPYSTEIKRHRRLRKGAWQDKLYDNPQCNASRRGSSEGWIGTSPGCRPRFMHGARVASEPTAAGARAAALADRYRNARVPGLPAYQPHRISDTNPHWAASTSAMLPATAESGEVSRSEISEDRASDQLIR